MARVLKGSHSFTCTPHVHPLTGMNHTCLCLPSRSWYSLPTPEGWKAELALHVRAKSQNVVGPNRNMAHLDILRIISIVYSSSTHRSIIFCTSQMLADIRTRSYAYTRNTFCGRWYLPHSHVHNERTVLL